MKKISSHISYKEATNSAYAKQFGIVNKPKAEHIKNMELVAEKVFEPLREWVGGAIKINSMFRSEELNKVIGGSSKSQHCHGQAMDIDDTYGYMSNADMYEYIKKNLSFDQMIWEFGTDSNPDWVHVSYVNEEANRNRCLLAYKDENNKTKYKTI